MGRAFEFRKERKMKRWAKMSKTFTRLGKDIVMAVKESGPDPDSNAKLRAVIQNCKAANMPKDNVERAIKRASNKDQEDYKEVIFEGYGPHGIAILIETATDNNTRTVANLRSYFNKGNGSLGTSGSVEFLFDHKCYFNLAKGDRELEELELELIDFGADEIFEEEESILVYAAFSDYGTLQKGIEELGLEVISSGFERIPLDTKKLTEEQEAEVDKLLERIEEDDDVQHVFHNMA
jgi:YebC/PmpR family DNA-binding regulatory protein